MENNFNFKLIANNNTRIVTDIKLTSCDTNAKLNFIFIDNDGNPIVLNENHSARASIYFRESDYSIVSDLKVNNNIATLFFDASWIAKWDVADINICLSNGENMVDFGELTLVVDLSESDKNIFKIKSNLYNGDSDYIY